MSEVIDLEVELSALRLRRNKMKEGRNGLATDRVQWNEEAQTLAQLIAAHTARRDTLDQTELDLNQEDGDIRLELTELKTEMEDVRLCRDRDRAMEDEDFDTFAEGLHDLTAQMNPAPAKDKKRKK